MDKYEFVECFGGALDGSLLPIVEIELNSIISFIVSPRRSKNTAKGDIMHYRLSERKEDDGSIKKIYDFVGAQNNIKIEDFEDAARQFIERNEWL